MENQFIILQPWLGQILNVIKKEIKFEHLAKSPAFHRAYFGTRPFNRLTSEEILQAYEKELLKGNEELSEWIVNRWVFQHGEIYRHFAERLGKINPDFDAISQLDEKQSAFVLEGAEEAFGALPTYTFAILNRVVFPASTFASMRLAAQRAESRKKEEEAAKIEQETLEQMKQRHEKEMVKLKEKCDDKIAGVAKKHAIDVEALKKQIRSLQSQLHAASAGRA